MLTLILSITGCSAFRFPGVYKIDIAQGNIVTPEALDTLKPGMSRQQVRFVLGSPMIVDTFDNNRWDYYASFTQGGGPVETRHITVHFDDNQMTHITGTVDEALPIDL